MAAAFLPAFLGCGNIHQNDTYEKGIVYDKERGLKLDLYAPQNLTEKTPVVLLVHGGGWVVGSRDHFRREGISFASSGVIAISVQYRLSNLADYPAQIVDLHKALDWIEANKDARFFDTDRIYAMGNSAGGHLVSVLGTESEPRVKGVINLNGPVDLAAFWRDCGADRCSDNVEHLLRELFECSLEECPERFKEASPLFRVTKKSASFLILHGDADKAVPVSQSINFHEKLKSQDIDSELIIFRGQGHHLFYDQKIILDFIEKSK